MPLLFMSAVIAGAFLVQPADATAGDELTLSAATAAAVANNPGLAEMQSRYEAMASVPPQVATLPDPMLSLNAANLPWDNFDLNQEPMTQLQIGVSQMFPFPGKLGLREDAADSEAQAALHSVDEMRLNLVLNVQLTWWDMYYLDRSIDTVVKNQTLLRQFVDIARSRYEVGKGIQQDVLLAQLELSKLLDNEIQLKTLRKEKAIRLNVLMGSPPDTGVSLPANMPAFSAMMASDDLLYQRALATRPLLKQDEAAVDASESRLALARKDYYPDFTVGVAYGNRQEDDLGQSRQDFLSVMLSMNLPLYTGTKQSHAVQQRASEAAKSRYALLDQKNMVYSSISSSTNVIRQSREQMSLYADGILPQARQTVDSMLAGYQVDEVDFLNLLRSQITLFSYELLYWKSFADLNQSLARLQAAVGQENIYE